MLRWAWSELFAVIVSIALLVGIGWCVDSIFCEVISMALGEG